MYLPYAYIGILNAIPITFYTIKRKNCLIQINKNWFRGRTKILKLGQLQCPVPVEDRIRTALPGLLRSLFFYHY